MVRSYASGCQGANVGLEGCDENRGTLRGERRDGLELAAMVVGAIVVLA
jgi:hypothetical protein